MVTIIINKINYNINKEDLPTSFTITLEEDNSDLILESINKKFIEIKNKYQVEILNYNGIKNTEIGGSFNDNVLYYIEY